MTYEEFEKEIREIAEYLGCNENELLNEMNNIIRKLNYTFKPTKQTKEKE